MSNNKKVFIVIAIIFFGAMAYISYDISSRTTFPGSKPQLQERIKEEILLDKDTTAADTTYLKTN